MGLCLMGSNMAEDRIKDHLVRISSHATHEPRKLQYNRRQLGSFSKFLLYVYYYILLQYIT